MIIGLALADFADKGLRIAAAVRGYTLLYMAKKALPLRVDADLLARVDACREVLGQTRTLFVERALEAALARKPMTDERALEIEQAFRDVDGHRVAPPVVLPSGKSVVVEPMSVSVARCPKATCSAAGPVGDRCPLHPNMSFKVL